MRFCLISPSHLSKNPRLVKEARALLSAGHQVHVIHGRYTLWGTRNDERLAESLGPLTAVPFGPVTAPLPRYLRQTIVRRGAHALVALGLRSRHLIELAHAPAVMDLTAEALAVPADVYVAHYVAALPAAARAAERHSAVYAFDAEDFHPGDLPDRPEHALEKRIIRTIEKRYLPGASYVTAASPLIGEAYAKEYSIANPSVILNCFPKTNGPPAPTASGQTTPGPSIYWFSQTIGPGRGLEVAVDAIARARSAPHLYLRGKFAAGYQTALCTRATAAGVLDRVHFLEAAPPDDLERLGAAYDLGYVGEQPETQNRHFALANKLFSYLISGLPILATDIPSHRRLASGTGEAMSLFATSDPDSLATAIDGLLLQPERLASARRTAWRLGQEQYNWEKEQLKLLEVASNAVSRKAMSRTSAAR